VTRVAVKEARSREISDQMARSDRLKVHAVNTPSFCAEELITLICHAVSKITNYVTSRYRCWGST